MALRENNLQEERIPQVNIGFRDTQIIDGSGALRVGQQHPLHESKLLSIGTDETWETRITGQILVHGAVTGGPFQVGDIITGGTSGTKATVTAVGSGNITVDNTITTTVSGVSATVGYVAEWSDTETITGSVSGASATLTTHNTGADCYYDYNFSREVLAVGTLSGQKVIRQTTRYYPYTAGRAQLFQPTWTFNAGKTGLKQTVMIGDDLNGIGYRMNGTTFELFIRTSTSGVAAEDEVATQSEFNIDRLDGTKTETNPSGITLDITKSQIGDIDFLWLGLGRVKISLNIDGKRIPIHEFHHSNESIGVYMKSPTLPIRYEIENTADTESASSLKQICSNLSSQGGFSIPGAEFCVPPIGVATERTLTTLNPTPILAIRLKKEYPAGKPNRHTIQLLGSSFNTRTNDAWFEVDHVHRPLTCTGTWTQLGNSAVEYSIDISAVTAINIHPVMNDYKNSGLAGSGQGESMNLDYINHHAFISQNYESDNSEMFVIFAKARVTNALVWAALRFIMFE